MAEEFDSIRQVIETAAAEPKKIAGDAGSYENPTLTELIEAHRYLRGTDPAVEVLPARAIRFSKLRPPGAV